MCQGLTDFNGVIILMLNCQLLDKRYLLKRMSFIGCCCFVFANLSKPLQRHSFHYFLSVSECLKKGEFPFFLSAKLNFLFQSQQDWLR
jgi:hypothetical protein